MKRNAYFRLIHKADGIFLQSFASQEGGKELSVDDVIWYLDQKKYAENVSSLEVQDFVQRSVIGQTLLKVSDNSEALPENEMVRITIDPHSYLAKIRLYPSSDKGSRLTEENVLSLLAQNDVHHGILMQNLTLLLKAELYCTDVLIAKAVLPVQGKRASITYHFDVQKTNTPTMKEDGSVDFHRLDMIERVEKGQLLATLTPETAPIPGTDVRGNVIQPAKLTPVVLKHGKNIHLSEDQLEMYADCAGNVTLVNDTVFVSNVYEVPADVGTSTGDIDYDGSVEVRGNVLTGYTVKATGDITVNGAVEGATLISGGKIVIKRGMQGMEKGVMRAGGDIISNFIESSKVHASGRIITDAIMHSDVEAADEIIVNGKRGLIVGGKIHSGLKITMKTAGSTMGTQTELEIGIDPTLLERYRCIERDMEKISAERDTLLQNIDILKKRLKSNGKLDEDKLTLLKSSAKRVQEIGPLIVQMSEEYDELVEEIESTQNGGRIVISEVAYPGVKMTIANVSSFIHNETKHSAFVRDGAEIRVRAI